MSTEPKLYYRAVIRSGSNYVSYAEFQVVRTTPKGAWVMPYYRSGILTVEDAKETGELRFALEDGRYCSATKKLALERLRARTRSYVKHAKRNLREAERRAAILALPLRAEPPPAPLRLWGFQ